MSNVCTPSNQIGTYAPSAVGSILFAKNIDCVTLEADLVSAGTLTVDGVDLSTYVETVEKTQNIDRALLGSTDFNGSLTVPQLITNQISALDPITGIEIGSTINHQNATTSSGNPVNITNPSLATNNTLGLLVGTSKTSNTNAWQILYVNANSAGSQINRLDFRMLGYFSPTLALTQGKVGVNTSAPTEALDVTGNAKISGGVYVSNFNGLNIGDTTTSIKNRLYFDGANTYEVFTANKYFRSNNTNILQVKGTGDLILLQGDLIATAGNTSLANVTANSLNIVQTVDQGVFLTFANDRPWVFKNEGTGASSSLTLFNEAGKRFNIALGDGTNIFSTYISGTVRNCQIDAVLTVSNNLILYGNLTQGTGYTCSLKTLTVSGSTTISGIITQTSGTANLKSLNVDGDVAVTDTLTANTISATSYIGLPIQSVEPLTLDDANNRVGINKVTPTEALDVTGNMVVSGNATVNGSLTVNDGLVMPGPVIHNMFTWTSASGSAIKTLTGIHASTVRAVKITFQNVGLSENTTAWLSIPGATIMEGEANSGGGTQVGQTGIPMCAANLKNDEALSGEIKLTKVFMSTAKTTWKWIVTGIMYADGGSSGISFNTTYMVGGIVSNATNNLTFNTVQYYAASGTASFNRSGSTSQYDYEY